MEERFDCFEDLLTLGFYSMSGELFHPLLIMENYFFLKLFYKVEGATSNLAYFTFYPLLVSYLI